LPPAPFPCHYGIDFPDPQELLANRMSLAEIRDYLEVDSLSYLSVDDMIGATGWPANSFCTACFSGDYPLPVDPGLRKDEMEQPAARGGFFSRETGGLFDPS